MFRRVLLFGFLLTFIAGAAFLGYLGWERYSARFPTLPAGRYLGEIDFENEIKLPLFVERREGSDTLTFVVLRPGWSVTKISVGAQLPALPADIMPVLLQGTLVENGPSIQIQIAGTQGDGEAQGLVRSATGVKQGTWFLNLIADNEEILSPGRRVETQNFLMRTRELAIARARLSAISLQVTQQKDEIAKLEDFMAQDRALTSRSTEEKLLKARDELRNQFLKLKPKLTESRKFESQLDLSQKITPMGRLASLSRDANEREVRWIDSVTRGGTPSNSQALTEAVAKSLRIVRLRELIAAESKRIKGSMEATPTP